MAIQVSFWLISTIMIRVKEILKELELTLDITEQGRERPSEYKNQEFTQINIYEHQQQILQQEA